MSSEVTSGSEQGIERRRHRRYFIYLPFEYKRSGNSAIRYGHTMNFSESGLMCAVKEEFRFGDKLEMKLFFSHDCLLSIPIALDVVWVGKGLYEDGFYHFGGAFSAIEAEHERLIKDFLNRYADPNVQPETIGARI